MQEFSHIFPKYVQMNQGKFVDYVYDGDGNRISKITGVKQPLMKEKPNQGKDNPSQEKVKKQQAEIISKAANNGGGNGNAGGNGGDNGNAGGNGNGKGSDKDDPDGEKNGKGKGNTKDPDKAKNKDLTQEERNKKKENAKQGKGYRQKSKYNNRGKHLGWYKNKKNKLEQQIEETYYLNDVSSDLSQVMMTYDDTGIFDTAYTYGVERIGIDILDGTRPDAQNPLYYLYDGQGSVTYVTKPDGEKRDTLTYDEFGKPRTGKLSPDGDKILHTSFGYNGEQWDEESNLQYLRARYYEPETGRFLSRDTYEGELANPLSKHLYAYVQNNPINKKDPTGHKMEPGTPEWYAHVKKDWTKEQIIDLQKFLNKNKIKDNKGKPLVVNGSYNNSTYEAHVKYFKSKNSKSVVKPKGDKKTIQKTVKKAKPINTDLKKHSKQESRKLAVPATLSDDGVIGIIGENLANMSADKAIGVVAKATAKKVASNGMKSAVPVVGQINAIYQTGKRVIDLPGTMKDGLYIEFTYVSNYQMYLMGSYMYDGRDNVL